jgi:hypothetical protein
VGGSRTWFELVGAVAKFLLLRLFVFVFVFVSALPLASGVLCLLAVCIALAWCAR